MYNPLKDILLNFKIVVQGALNYMGVFISMVICISGRRIFDEEDRNESE